MCGAIILQLYYNLVCFTLLKLNHKKVFMVHCQNQKFLYFLSPAAALKIVAYLCKRKQFCLLLLNYTFLLVCRIQTRRMHKTPFTSEFQTAEIIYLHTKAKVKVFKISTFKIVYAFKHIIENSATFKTFTHFALICFSIFICFPRHPELES